MTADLPIIVVAGLGRCGSSLTMQMLHAGGVPCEGRYPDFEKRRSLEMVFPVSWADSMAGRAVKLLDRHFLPIPPRPFVTIWLDRDPEQQARSMLKLIGAPAGRRERRAFVGSIRRDSVTAKARLAGSPTLHLNFEDLIGAPEASATALRRFLWPYGFPLDAEAAAAAVRPRGTDCLPGFLELELLAMTNAAGADGGQP